jgi:hypothetical protein
MTADILRFDKFKDLAGRGVCNMSGHKKATVTLSEDEYRRLHDAEMQFRFMKRKLPEMIQVERDENLALIHDNLNRMEERQENYKEIVNQLDDQLRTIEMETADALVEQHNRMEAAFDELNDDLLIKTENVLSEQARIFEEMLIEEHNQRQAQLMEIEGQMLDLSQKEQMKADYVIHWLEQCLVLSNFIKDHYAYKKFSPGTLEKIEQNLYMAQENLEYDSSEAALVIAQTAYVQLSELRLVLERQQSSWQILHQTCLLTARRFLDDIENCQNLPALDLDGNELPENIDIDYWSGRKLSRLAEHGRNIIQQLEKDKRLLDHAALNTLLHETIPGMQQALDKAVFEARWSALNSQIRINIADLVIQALEQQGFTLQNALYNNHDLRKAFTAQVQNYQGNEVVIQVNPIAGDVGKNELQLISLDEEQRTQHELTQRSREIAESLKSFGLNVGSIDTVQEHLIQAQTGSQSGRGTHLTRTTSSHGN